MITIVTDSSSYFKKSEAEALGIKVVPINYTVNGQIYFESFSDCNGEYENLIKTNKSFTTSQPNMSSFLSTFEDIVKRGGDILCITISSRLSGAFSAAYMAAKNFDGKRVTVFDSMLTAGGLYLLIKEAHKMAGEGLPVDDIVSRLEKIREKISIAFSVDDMVPLRRSGRIGFVRLGVGTILNIRPILLLKDGVVISDGTVRGNTEIIRNLSGRVSARTTAVVINFIDNTRLATNLYNVIKANHPEMPIKLQKLGPVLGIHLGLGVVAVSVLDE